MTQWNLEDSEEITLMCQREINANIERYTQGKTSIHNGISGKQKLTQSIIKRSRHNEGHFIMLSFTFTGRDYKFKFV